MFTGAYFWHRFYLFVFVYSFLQNGKSNFFSCSYIISQYSYKNWIIGAEYSLTMFLTILFIKILLSNNKQNETYYNDYLITRYFITYSTVKNVIKQIYLVLNIFFNKFRFFILNSKNFNLFYLFLNFKSTWNPIFKKSSYFGYFRVHRTVWNPIRTEEYNSLNQLKI